MRRILPLLLSIVLIAAACGDDSSSTDAGDGGGDGGGAGTSTTTTTTTEAPIDTSTPEGQLTAARAQWAANGTSSYVLTTQQLCFCPPGEWIDTVVDGEVTGHAFAGNDSFFDPGPRTMETLFDEIEAVLAADYASIDLSFDAETGAVERYYVDVDEMMADEENGVEVISVESYDSGAVPEPVEITAAALADDYGCGYGFAKSSADQTLSLVITWTGGFTADPTSPAGPVGLPAADWEAEIRTGADLFANWCDDVIEIDEPTPVTTSEWSIVAGTLTITSDLPLSTDGQGTTTATLSGAVAESATGEQVTLDDIGLVNTCWGCFAG